MALIVVLAVLLFAAAVALRWGADSRTGDDWRRRTNVYDGVGGPLR